jgi:hypothetical protein
MIALVSNPDGVLEVTIDDAFMGNAPAKLRLKAGAYHQGIDGGIRGLSRDDRDVRPVVSLAATLEKTPERKQEIHTDHADAD